MCTTGRSVDTSTRRHSAATEPAAIEMSSREEALCSSGPSPGSTSVQCEDGLPHAPPDPSTGRRPVRVNECTPRLAESEFTTRPAASMSDSHRDLSAPIIPSTQRSSSFSDHSRGSRPRTTGSSWYGRVRGGSRPESPSARTAPVHPQTHRADIASFFTPSDGRPKERRLVRRDR